LFQAYLTIPFITYRHKILENDFEIPTML